MRRSLPAKKRGCHPIHPNCNKTTTGPDRLEHDNRWESVSSISRTRLHKEQRTCCTDCLLRVSNQPGNVPLKRIHSNERKTKRSFRNSTNKTKRRAYTGIEPVTSRTLSENHTTRPAGLVNVLSTGLLLDVKQDPEEPAIQFHSALNFCVNRRWDRSTLNIP